MIIQLKHSTFNSYLIISNVIAWVKHPIRCFMGTAMISIFLGTPRNQINTGWGFKSRDQVQQVKGKWNLQDKPLNLAPHIVASVWKNLWGQQIHRLPWKQFSRYSHESHRCCWITHITGKSYKPSLVFFRPVWCLSVRDTLANYRKVRFTLIDRIFSEHLTCWVGSVLTLSRTDTRSETTENCYLSNE